MNTGATVWARKTTTSDIFGKPDKWFKIWFYLVNQVNHKDIGQFKRGTGFMTYEMIMLATRATKAEVDHCIRWLKKYQMLATARATRGIHITILNYELYQDLGNYKSDSKSDSKAIQKRHDKQVCKNVSNRVIPKELDFPEFLAMWALWEKHRSQIRKPLTPLSVEQQLKKLSTVPQQAVAIIEKSIQNGWTGIFLEKKDAKRSRKTGRDFSGQSSKHGQTV